METTTHIAVHLPVSGETQELVLAVLSSLPFEGCEEKEEELIVHIKAEDFREDSLQAQLALLPFSVPYSLTSQSDQNWNALWEASYDPILLGDFCRIRAPFHPPSPYVQHELIIQPQMSFGTGHHETTQSMMYLMQEVDFEQKVVLDMGCGTGVLGILAEKLGASEVECMDIDTRCIDNSLENCQLNQTATVVVRLREEMWKPADGRFDIILANINLNILTHDIPLYHRGLKKGGLLMLSGFYQSDSPVLLTILHNLGFEERSQKVRNKWAALSLRKN